MLLLILVVCQCTSLFSFFQLQCLLEYFTTPSSEQVFILDCILMCQQSQNKCSVDIAASNDSSVANARQLMQGIRWKNFGRILQLEKACLAILIVLLKYCFSKLYFFFSTEGSKPSRMQAAVKQCVCGLEDYLHCNSLNTTISYLQPYVLYLGRIK